ncbi:MAG: hypothetical protein AAFX79_02905 [Planctomycetota bacterium]
MHRLLPLSEILRRTLGVCADLHDDLERKPLEVDAIGSTAQCEPRRRVAPDGVQSTTFGSTVAMNDRHLLVGDPMVVRCAAPGSCYAGAMHAYRLVDGAWTLGQIVVPPDATYGDRFGYRIDLDGDRMIVGSVFAQLAGFSAGAAYVYEFDGTQWIETGRIAPPEPIAWSDFGSRVGIDGDLAAVGEGAAYLFRRQPDGDWRQAARLVPPTTSYLFGLSVATWGGRAANAAPASPTATTAARCTCSILLACCVRPTSMPTASSPSSMARLPGRLRCGLRWLAGAAA